MVPIQLQQLEERELQLELEVELQVEVQAEQLALLVQLRKQKIPLERLLHSCLQRLFVLLHCSLCSCCIGEVSLILVMHSLFYLCLQFIVSNFSSFSFEAIPDAYRNLIIERCV